MPSLISKYWIFGFSEISLPASENYVWSPYLSLRNFVAVDKSLHPYELLCLHWRRQPTQIWGVCADELLWVHENIPHSAGHILIPAKCCYTHCTGYVLLVWQKQLKQWGVCSSSAGEEVMESGAWSLLVSIVRKQGDVCVLVLSSLAHFHLIQDLWDGAAHI